MYRYEYENLDVGGGFWIDNSANGHRRIIDKRADQGWRYVGYVPTRYTSNGGIKEVDLIFEKEV